MKLRMLVLSCSVVGCAANASPPSATPATGATAAVVVGRPVFDPKTDELQPPTDYRSWMFLTSGFQMGYGPAALAAAAGGIGSYDTVFVDPVAYHSFVATGVWPDRTMFVLEIRSAEHTGSIVTTGHYQTDILGIEAEIKDARLPGGWGFFDFAGGPRGPAKRIPDTAGCYSCHAENAGVENTFTQFYPTMFEIARAKGTVRKDFVGIPPGVAEVRAKIIADGIAAGRAQIADAATKWPEATIAKEASLNRLGYELVQAKRIDDALAIFEEVTRRFPESANAWDSYAETLEGAKQLAPAKAATAKGLAVIAQMPAGPRRDAIEKVLRERAARLP